MQEQDNVRDVLSQALQALNSKDDKSHYFDLHEDSGYMHFDNQYLVLPLIINLNERITRILGMIEIKQNGLCVFCKERITRNHATVSSGWPRHYYHKSCAIRLNVI
jgi:hypothetical protein